MRATREAGRSACNLPTKWLPAGRRREGARSVPDNPLAAFEGRQLPPHSGHRSELPPPRRNALFLFFYSSPWKAYILMRRMLGQAAQKASTGQDFARHIESIARVRHQCRGSKDRRRRHHDGPSLAGSEPPPEQADPPGMGSCGHKNHSAGFPARKCSCSDLDSSAVFTMGGSRT